MRCHDMPEVPIKTNVTENNRRTSASCVVAKSDAAPV